jgi:hypothetical protein
VNYFLICIPIPWANGKGAEAKAVGAGANAGVPKNRIIVSE